MGEIKIGSIPLGMYRTNCYFVYREDIKDAIVIDPADKGELIYDKLKETGITVKAILLTHGHFDHIFGVKALKKKAGVKVYAYEKEAKLLEDPSINVSEDVGRPESIIPDEFLKDGQTVTIADMTFKVLFTPGHTGGSCCYYFEEPGILICGDTLFMESVGRTDLPTGSSADLIDSIKTKLLPLPDATLVYPGHGESTTIGHERKYNSFLD